MSLLKWRYFLVEIWFRGSPRLVPHESSDHQCQNKERKRLCRSPNFYSTLKRIFDRSHENKQYRAKTVKYDIEIIINVFMGITHK